MSGNKWGVIPEEARVLEELEKLIGKSIPHMTEIVGGEPGFSKAQDHIVELSLDKCGLTYLPESITTLKSIRHFTLADNALVNLPESIGDLSSLHRLDLSKNKLRALPQSFGNLSSLKWLFIVDSEGFNVFPGEVCNLRDLDGLFFHNNGITALPETIGNLTSLSYFHISKNKLKTLPETIGKLKNLVVLDLSDNQLETLPNSIGDLKKLQFLSLIKNNLSNLPDLSRKPTALKYLILSGNKLTTLPKWVWQLKRLTTLEVEGNPWEEGSQVMKMLARNLTAINSLFEYFESKEGRESLKSQKIEETAINVLNDFFKRKKVEVFISYATSDSERLHIPEIAEGLKNKSQDDLQIIAHYWEGWDGYPNGNIIDFMEQHIMACHIFIPIFTKAMRESENCKKERDLASFQNKQVIPVFEDFNEVPAIFRPKKGINISNKEVMDIVEELFEQINALRQK